MNELKTAAEIDEMENRKRMEKINDLNKEIERKEDTTYQSISVLKYIIDTTEMKRMPRITLHIHFTA